MAIVKVMPRDSARKVIHYIYKKLPEDPVDSELCTGEPEEIISQFKAVRDAHNQKKGALEVIHVIQSWNKEDSEKMTPEQANALGRKLVGEYWKGHQFVVVTHSDKGHLHNHIALNPVNMETGKRIWNKKEHFHNLAAINDQICKEAGLQVLTPYKKKAKDFNLPEKARQILKNNRQSYILDLAQKCNFAASWATSYDEFTGYMQEFGIRVHVENKNISYFYPGREKGKRGSKLGLKYDKPHLETTFKENDERFAKHPEVRDLVRGRGGGLTKLWQDHVKQQHAANQLKGKDYGAFTPATRRGRGDVPDSELKLSNSMIPIEEFRRARSGNMIEYCNNNGIGLIETGQGWYKLKGREHVTLSAYDSINTRNGHHGNLIDLVSAHHHVNYLQAIAKINGNPRLLLLEKAFGEQKLTFTPFHVPKSNSAGFRESKDGLSRFLKTHGIDERVTDQLLKFQQAHVERGGRVHLFPQGEATGSLEFSEPESRASASKKKGEFRKPFFASRGTGKKAVVFSDPISFMQKRGNDIFSAFNRKDGILALMEPSESMVHQYVAAHPHVKEIQLVQLSHRPPSQVELDFFDNLKRQLAPFKIEVAHVSWEKALTRNGPELSL